MKKYILKHKWILLFATLVGGIIQGMDVYIQLLFGSIIDALAAGQREAFTGYIVIAVIVTVVLYVGVAVTARMFFAYGFKSYRTLSREFFDSVLGMKFDDFNKENSAKYISMLNNDIQTIATSYFAPVANFSKDAISVALAIAATAWLSPLNAVISVLSGVMMLISPLVYAKRLSKTQERQSTVGMLFNQKIKDFFNGFEVIRTYGIGKNIKPRFNKVVTMYMRALFGSGAAVGDMGALNIAMSTGVLFLNYFVAGYFVLRGDISVGNIVTIIALSTSIMQPMGAIAGHLGNMTAMKEVSKRVLDVMAQKDNTVRTANIETLEGDIALTNVSFSYAPDKPPAVNGLSYTFKKNGKYAVVGASGSGKSTLAKLLMGYHDEYGGQISVNGHNVRDINRDSLYKVFSALHQNVFLFDDTLRNNITLYNEYTPAEYDSAVSKASLVAVQSALAEGAETELGEGGNTLSGGERQRVSIARALIKGSDVIICDEATASLDNITATEIETGLIGMEGITCIFTTHKYNSEILEKVDGILVMKNGELVEQGTFKELFREGSYFTNLYHGAEEV